MVLQLVNQIWHGDSVILGERFHAKRKIQSVITDPPYGIDDKSNFAKTPEGKMHSRKIANDETPEIAQKTFTDVMQVLIKGMTDESDIYIFVTHQVLEEWLAFTKILLEPHGFVRKAIIVWEKDGPGMGDTNCGWGMGCVFILYYKRGKRPKGMQRRNSVIHLPQVNPNKLIHPHQKPLPLLELMIQESTSVFDLVVDPFGGSGSLVHAARNLSRHAVAIEYDLENYNRAVKWLNESEGAGIDFG